MNPNIEHLQQNLEKWISAKENKVSSLKKEIIKTISNFRQFFSYDLIVMLRAISKKYDVCQNFEPIIIASDEKSNLNNQNYVIKISTVVDITLCPTKEHFNFVTFNCYSQRFYVQLMGYKNSFRTEILSTSSDELNLLTELLNKEKIEELIQIYDFVSKVSDLIKDPNLMDDMAIKCNKKIESLLSKF